MNAWDTLLGQRTMEAINSIARDVDKIKDNQPTLRDYFAAQFLNGYAINLRNEIDYNFIAYAAYKMADAMLEARKNNS